MKKNGQTVIEAIVALGVVMLLLFGLIAAATASLSLAKNSAKRSAGVKYVQEGLEIVRRIRDNSWTTFLSYDGGTYCLNKDGSLTEKPGGQDCPSDLEDTYNRQVTFAFDSTDNRMSVTMRVRWQESDKIREVAVTTFFTNWQ